ncbi:ABC transporter substrate-binding protein [Halococcus hamelinensis]|uniref:Putative iron-III ABC transporter periplasmic substrate-binding protein n=1 Tax=Halococcus hamelinensis 100A6 TaxID=1132509 RepID=M0LX06_9EURY|nr:ABC transporter substrate-binding protein [Halococcus hamelinensis]EMA36630.1 putative iron-III ABC transporter periplasmic substrate-binding protein [Halococcus hamelinensis 100A6]
MTDDDPSSRRPTRRDYVKYGGAIVGGGLLAGCSGQSSSDSESTERASDSTSGEGATGSSATASDTDPTSTGDATSSTAVETGTASSGSSYTAELSPVGTVTLDAPPENVFTHFPWFPDMASALGQGDTINDLWWDGTVEGLEYFTTEFDGFEVEWADEAGEYGFTKERLYELDSDLHLVDPAWVTTEDNWSRSDVEEVTNNVGPWLGNYYSSYHGTPPKGWADGYEYTTLWELFDRVASLYGERERYEALASVHDDLLGTVEDGLPPKSERPSVAYVSVTEDLSEIYRLRLNAPGYWNAHTRPLGATDAFGNESFSGPFNQIDLEALLAADPDVVLALWTVTETVDFGTLKRNLENDPIGSELSAVGNERVYPQGTRWQGPLMNLFQTEMTAKELYPDRFGEWPDYRDGDPYPEFGPDEQLFDHRRVANVVTGND